MPETTLAAGRWGTFFGSWVGEEQFFRKRPAYWCCCCCPLRDGKIYERKLQCICQKRKSEMKKHKKKEKEILLCFFSATTFFAHIIIPKPLKWGLKSPAALCSLSRFLLYSVWSLHSQQIKGKGRRGKNMLWRWKHFSFSLINTCMQQIYGRTLKPSSRRKKKEENNWNIQLVLKPDSPFLQVAWIHPLFQSQISQT